MKCTTTLAFLLCLAGGAAAQNNPIFYGGAADGHSTGRNAPQSAINQGGGGGDGSNAAIKVSLYPTNNTGGAGDGSNVGIKSGPLPVTGFGGAGDGHSTGSKAAPLALTNNGGGGDGHSSRATIPVLPRNQRGGRGDGWSNDTFIGPFTPPVPLPQEFLSFTAAKQNDDALLNWKMGDEKGIDRYIVERSSNAVTFARIGEVVWEEAANAHYRFVDEAPLRGHNYYRIRVMAAGEEKLTPVRLVIFDELRSTLAMTLYPNPASTQITAQLPAAWLGTNTVLNVYSASGTLVLQQKLVPLSVTDVTVPVEVLAPGVYTLQAATDGESLRAPFIKR